MRLLLWLAAPPAAAAAAFQLQPTYVVLDIPVTPNPVGYFWWEEQLSQLAYADSWGVLYLRRQVGAAYPETQGWRTSEEALAYFQRWLIANGWTDTGSVFDADPALPESRHLTPEHRRRFHRGGDPDIRLTVAVWPIGGAVEGFHVVVTTERSSWARKLQQGLD